MISYYHMPEAELEKLDDLQQGCWIHIGPPFNNDAIEKLAVYLEVPLDFLTDSMDIDERSRYEVEEGVRLIVVNTPLINEIDQENEAIYITGPIGIILTDNHIVTITSFESDVLQKFLDGRVKNFNPHHKKRFVLQILEQNVLRYLDSLKKLNLKRNIIEKELYHSARNEELKQLLRIEKSLVYFVNSLSANELLKLKMKRTNLLKIDPQNEYLTDLFEDIIIDNSQALEMSNVYTNILGGTMDAYTSIISNNLNFFIQRLTLITIILSVPTLVASLFGMNVPVPFAETKISFYFIIILSLVFSIAMVWFFKRKNIF